MPRGKRLTEGLVKKMAAQIGKGLTYADVGRKFGINPDTVSIHVRALKSGLPAGTVQTGPIQASTRKTRVYKAPKETNVTRETANRDAQLMRSQAKGATRDMRAFRSAAMGLAAENVSLRMQIAKLKDELAELQGGEE